MSDAIILHHYWNSPFSEKVRLLLGLKGLAWRSAIQPTIMPKPDLTPLTGGYRRIPVMQIGADVFCDSGVIMAEIERRSPSPKVIHGGDWAVNQWADRQFFPPVVAIIFGAIGHMVPDAFIKDREALSGRPFDVAAMKAAAAPMVGQFQAYALWLETQLAEGGAWVGGASASLADIAWYMNFWFYRSALGEALDAQLAGLPHVGAWMAQVRALGHGRHDEITPQAAIDEAAACEPADWGDLQVPAPDGPAPGAPVHVTADDYGREPIVGTLVAAGPERIVIAREDPRVGRVNVHFPRTGFLVTGA